MEKQKRERSANWSEEEKRTLLDLVTERIKIVENKSCDGKFIKMKSEAWKDISKLFRSQHGLREIPRLKEQWRRMKMCSKSKICAMTKHHKKTGGGVPLTSVNQPSECDWRIKDLLPQEFVKDSNIYDDDNEEGNENWENSESDVSDTADSDELETVTEGLEVFAMDTIDSVSRRQATRVFKKSSPNGKITVYLGKRDFVDHITHVDPIDGVVLIDQDYVKNRKVFGHVLAAFRYGREDLDVLGLTFRKDLYLAAEQIYPALPESQPPRTLTRLQERLVKKLGRNAFPFYFELPPHCPASVTLQPAPGDTGKPCGVDYELKAFVGETQDDKSHKRNSVRLAIRKIMYAPSKQGEQPSVEVSKEFMMSPNKLHLEASLDKELYHHGENIAVNVHIANNSNRTVKKIKVSVRQFADICLFSTAQYKCTVAEAESEERCSVGPGFTLSKVFWLTPLLANNKDKWGLALDGQLKHEDTNLASSTLVADPSQRENLGIIVQYKVKVKLCLGALGGDLVAELPFILMHPKPKEETQTPATARPSPTHQSNDGEVPLDTNLIQLDTDADVGDDDIIFEDFARLRLKGETDA